MSTPVVSLGGVALGGNTVYSWALVPGTAPYEAVWKISEKLRPEIESMLGKPQELIIEGPRKKLKVQQVYPLEIMPGNDPFTFLLRVADRRWIWPRSWVTLPVNIRRTTTQRKLVSEEDDPIEIARIDPTISYAAYSLFPPGGDGRDLRLWDGETVVRYVLGLMGVAELVFKDVDLNVVELVDLLIDDQGNVALDRALQAIGGGVDLYVDTEGKVVLFNSAIGSVGELDIPKNPLVTGPYPGKTDRRHLRPSEIVVIFTPELEVRFDSIDLTDSPSEPFEGYDDPYIFNVIPIPDVTLTFDDGRTSVSGSIERIDRVFTAWGNQFGATGSEPLNDAVMRRWVMKADAFPGIWGAPSQASLDALKMERVNAAVNHWRRTYQISPTFMGRLESIKPHRVVVLNEATGTRAASPVYCSYIRCPNVCYPVAKNDAYTDHGWAVAVWPGYSSYLTPLSEATGKAPADVAILDADSGIIRIVPHVDPYGLYTGIALGYPSRADGYSGFPDHDIGKANREEAFGKYSQVTLLSNFLMTTIMTVVPGFSGTQSMWTETIKTSDILPGEHLGPRIYTRVFPGLMTAKFAWSDDERDAILNAIRGRGPLPGGKQLQDAQGQSFSKLLTNDVQVRAVANAVARRILAGYSDRLANGADVDLDPTAEIKAGVTSIEHVMGNGATVTQFRYGGARQPADVWRFLDANTRRAIMRIP